MGELRRGLATGDEERGRLFYAQSFALVEFLAETEGPEFIGTLAAALARGESLGTALLTATRVPQDLTALDVAWRDWLSRRENKQGSHEVLVRGQRCLATVLLLLTLTKA
jgi:hypothetical protein